MIVVLAMGVTGGLIAMMALILAGCARLIE